MTTNNIYLSDALEGYYLHAQARRLSPNTINDYANTHNRFLDHIGNLAMRDITIDDISDFLATQTHLTKKSLLNYHTGLSALYTWAASQKIVETNIVRDIPRPRPEKRAIKDLTESEVRAILSALTWSAEYKRPGKCPCKHRLPTAERDKAIVLLLLDTGIRASELCALQIRHLKLKARSVHIYGKGDKERTLPVGANSSQALWKYLATRSDDILTAPLFACSTNHPLSRHQLFKMVKRAGEKADISDRVNPHRFRHTFAINYLRNGGDAYTLQAMLGHTTLKMVKRYLRLANTDLERVHRIASPADNWRL